jgi:serine/threonine protein kinase
VITGYHVGWVIAVAEQEGIPLDQWLDDAPRSWRAVADVFLDIGRNLAAEHAKGFSHQEIRIDNVSIGRDGRAHLHDLKPVVTDLPTVGPSGLRTAAVSIEDRLAQMHSTEAAAYLAPEQFKGWVADARSNQFSFCVALYRALYRQPPFDPEWAASQAGEAVSRRTPLGSISFELVVRSLNRTSLINLAREVLGGNLRAPPDDTDVPQWLEQVVRRGLQADPDERYRSMDDLVDDLAGGLAGTPRGTAPSRMRRLGKWAIVCGVGLAMVALGILAKVAGWGR